MFQFYHKKCEENANSFSPTALVFDFCFVSLENENFRVGNERGQQNAWYFPVEWGGWGDFQESTQIGSTCHYLILNASPIEIIDAL